MLRVWDSATVLGSSSSSKGKGPKPLLHTVSVPNVYPQANLAFSPDESMIVAASSRESRRAPGTTGSDEGQDDRNNRPALWFFAVSASDKDDSDADERPPALVIGLGDAQQVGEAHSSDESGGSGGIAVQWAAQTNQILCSCAHGGTLVYFDPDMSRRGALLTSARAPKRNADPLDFAEGMQAVPTGPIFTPGVRGAQDVNDYIREAKKGRDGNNAVAKKRDRFGKVIGERGAEPAKPATTGPGTRVNTSFHYQEFLTKSAPGKGKGVEVGHADPRESLLQYAADAAENPLWFGREKTILAEQTLEEEQIEFKDRQKRFK